MEATSKNKNSSTGNKIFFFSLLSFLRVNSISCSQPLETSTTIGHDYNVINYEIRPTSHLLFNEFSDNSNNTLYNRYLTSKQDHAEKNKRKKYNFRMNLIHNVLQDINEQLETTSHQSAKLNAVKEQLNQFEVNRHHSRYEQQYQKEMQRKLRRNQEEDRIQETPLMQGLGTHYITAWVSYMRVTINF